MQGNAVQQLTGLKARLNSYDEGQKQKLVVLGQGPKPYKDILAYLEAEIKTSTKMTNVRYEISCFKSDGVFQLNKAIESIYGAAQGKGDDKPSGGVANLETVDVILADGSRRKVPYGKIELPDCGEDAYIDIKYDHSKNILLVLGSVQFKFSSMIDEIIDMTKLLLNTASIYKNQAIELDSDYQPTIMDLSAYENEPVILSKDTKHDLNGLYARIRKPEYCVKNGISLKTGIMLEGPYGTGKTLLAFNIGWEAINENWVFVYLKDPKLLAKTLKLSKTLDKNGNGVIVFLEDVDQVTSGGRDDALQDILNTLDGGDTKQMNVISIFSTNHIDKINPTFLRGKRIGSIVSLGALDADTAMQFLTLGFGANYNFIDDKMEEACNLIAESKIVPAFMAEIIETVKSNLVFEGNSDVTSEKVMLATKSYLRQVGLSQKKDDGKTLPEILSEAVRDTVITKEMKATLEDIRVSCCD